ncbi:AraC family transcriptional regulator [Vibrio viridaestus]|nr:AraC family transcriptional regulator [Vibrio viridaestus]
MKNICNTSTIEANERLDYWHSSVCQTYASVDIQSCIRDYQGTISKKQFDELTITASTGDKINFQRTKSKICTDIREEIQVSLLLKGDVSIESNGVVTKATPGDILIYDSTRPFELRMEQFSTLTTLIPKSLLAIDELGGVLFEKSQLVTSIISKVLLEISYSDLDCPTISQNSITSNFVNLIESNLKGHSSCDSKGIRIDSQVDRIKQYLESQLSNPDVTIESVANSMSMSPRTLYRIFSKEGETVMGWLWKKRLSEAHREISTGRFKRVGVAALEYGFSDFSHFSRAFKKQYGYTPTSLLKNGKITF